MTHDTHRYRDFLSIVLHGGRLYAVSLQTGELYPLYIYGPLQDSLDAGHAPAPLDKWPDYARTFVAQYVPLPVILTNLAGVIAERLPNAPLTDELLQLIPEALLPRNIRDDISAQHRLDDTYPWEQTTFRLWPLYYAGPGLVVDETRDRPTLFRPATLDLRWLTQPDRMTRAAGEDKADYTFPPPGLGP